MPKCSRRRSSVAGVREKNSRSSPRKVERAGVGIEADHVAVADLGDRRRRRTASGVMWMAAGTLPEAPDMRPSVSSATLKPRSCRTPSAGVSLCSSGMPTALRALEAHDGDDVAGELAGLEGGLQALLGVEHARRGLDDAVLAA